MYYAHTKSDPQTNMHLPKEEWQPLSEHLKNVALLAGKFAENFGSSDIACLIGQMHDIGKYSDAFQKHLEGGPSTDHSTAGAQEIAKAGGPLGKLLAYCIAGHHAGLPDGGSLADTSDEPTLCGRLCRKIEKHDAYLTEFPNLLVADKLPPEIKQIGKGGFTIAFFLRMLFSCLVDADYLDTERAMNDNIDRTLGNDLDILRDRLTEHCKQYQNPKKPINQKRSQILQSCTEKANYKKGLFTLTVPTGGGKTITSLSFALNHAIQHHMKRVIYVIPYNSIIEQNAKVFKKIVGAENVLEHHSGIDYDDEDELSKKQRLATENWDVPLVVTTSVQFFESLFSNRTSKCRKLHNITNSVIIFDEAQMLPLPFLQSCIHTIAELVTNYGCSAVLCTATQPALDPFFPKELPITELCDDHEEMFRFFKRTEFHDLGILSDQELIEKLSAENQALCIVNSKRQAQALFELLKDSNTYHLSTAMYPLHREKVLDEIRIKLSAGEPCRVISTSLIEAGVDIDFPAVYRSKAGLDSEIQAAGRCNREKTRPNCPTYLFEPEEKYRQHLPAQMERPIETAKGIEKQFQDITSPEAIKAYFETLYQFSGDNYLDAKGTFSRFENALFSGSFPFASVAEDFQLIGSGTYTILIPIEEEAAKIAEEIRYGRQTKTLLRQAQKYCVNVYPNQYNDLLQTHSIEALDSSIAILVSKECYSAETGLAIKQISGLACFA